MTLTKVNLDSLTERLTTPFAPLTIATVNDMAINVILSQGQFPWHQHDHMDEIFYVHRGQMLLETMIGHTTLYAGELVLAPADIPHSPSSTQAAVVLFMLKYQMFQRNGYHNKLPAYAQLPDKINLAQHARALKSFEVDELTQFDDFALRLFISDTAQPWHQHTGDDEFVLVCDGHGQLELDDERVELNVHDVIVTPMNRRHRLVGIERATFLLLSRARASVQGS